MQMTRSHFESSLAARHGYALRRYLHAPADEQPRIRSEIMALIAAQRLPQNALSLLMALARRHPGPQLDEFLKGIA